MHTGKKQKLQHMNVSVFSKPLPNWDFRSLLRIVGYMNCSDLKLTLYLLIVDTVIVILEKTIKGISLKPL